jgi:hypothetical protein
MPNEGENVRLDDHRYNSGTVVHAAFLAYLYGWPLHAV